MSRRDCRAPDVDDDVDDERRTERIRPGEPITPWTSTTDWCDELHIEDEPHDMRGRDSWWREEDW